MKSNEERLASIRKYCKLLESQFKIPGTKFSFGIDPLLNLIPGIGSYSGLVLGFIFILVAHRQGVSGKAKILMFRNILIDFFLGLIPVLGNITDFVYKSNEKNMLLLEQHLTYNQHQGSGWQILLVFALIILGILALSIWVMVWVLQQFSHFLNSL